MTNNTVKKRTRAAKGDMLFYVLMMAWPILQFCVFYIAVKFNSILYSFQRYDKLSRTFTWTLDYVKSALKMMTTSPALVETMKMTLLFFVLFTGINTPLGLLFSYYISKKQFASGFFRVFLFLPSIICSVIMVLIYGNFVDVALPEIVRVLTGKTVGGLMSTKSTRFFAVMFYNLLVGFGVNVLMYSNAMSAISEEVVEAAHLDGATGLKEFWFITLWSRSLSPLLPECSSTNTTCIRSSARASTSGYKPTDCTSTSRRSQPTAHGRSTRRFPR